MPIDIFPFYKYVFFNTYIGIATDNCLSSNCYVDIGKNIFTYQAGSYICQDAGGHFPYPKTSSRANDLLLKFGPLWIGLTADTEG